MGIFDWLLGKKSKDDGEALIDAALEGHTETVEMLLAKGADVNAKNKDGETALMDAAMFGHTEIVEMLLTKGAGVNAKDNVSWTALIVAAREGHTETVETLLAKGADVNAKDKDGITALMDAARFGHTKIAEMLLTKGARVNAKDIAGQTALDSAGNKEIKKLLRQAKEGGAKATKETESLSLEEEAETLIMLLVKAYQWGESHRFPLHSKYPQYKQIRSIGERLYREGGIKRMRRVFDAVTARERLVGGSFLEWFWDDIGPWKA